jgi:16S rRNA pseudouridine516 synthase
MRLDRFLSHATGLSRSQSLRAIRQGQVRVAGIPVTDPGMPVSPWDTVEYDGAALSTPGHRYLMLHKPAGCVCATRDPVHSTVLSLIDVPRPEGLHVGRSRSPSSRGTRASLHVVGRLDIDATGLVLITDDGEWSHRVTSPRHKFPKTYRVTLAEPLGEAAIAALERGVFLKNEKHRCRPAQVERIAENEARVTITEGRYHQVKRMFAAAGNRVTALHRERVGAVMLDARLKPGESRALTAEEVESFLARPGTGSS